MFYFFTVSDLVQASIPYDIVIRNQSGWDESILGWGYNMMKKSF